jgi:hypothetical protein
MGVLALKNKERKALACSNDFDVTTAVTRHSGSLKMKVYNGVKLIGVRLCVDEVHHEI